MTGIGLTGLNIDGKGDIDAYDLDLHRGGTLPQGVDTGLEIIRRTMPLDDSPAVQSAWWDGLSGPQRDMYLKAVPLEIAGMAGIPVAVRRHPSGPDLGEDYSSSWGGAQQQHDFFVSQRAQVIDPADARPGDVLYLINEGTTGEVHHTALVTEVLPNGDIPYTQVQGGTPGVEIVR